jgi:type II secretory pathway component GspD/PulD (secretin)
MLRLTQASAHLIAAMILTLGTAAPLAAQQRVLPLKVQDAPRYKKAPRVQDAQSAPRPESQTTIIKLRNVPASELAESLARSLGNRGIEITAEPITNSLLVTASPEALLKTATLVKALDLPPAMINIDVSLVELSGDQGAITEAFKTAGAASAELVVQLIKSGKVRVLNQLRVTALDNTEARVHSQEQKAVPVGRVFAGSRGGTRTTAQPFEERETGTMVIVRPKQSGESEISLDLQLESTRLEMPPNASATDDATDAVTTAASLRTLTTSIHTTVRIPQGRPVLIQAATRQDGDSSRQFAVLVNATIGTAYANPQPASRRKAAVQPPFDPNNTTVVLYLRNAVAEDAKKVVVEVYRDFAGKLNITADARTNALFIQGNSDTIEQVEELLKALDSVDPKAKPEATIKDIQDALKKALPRAINPKSPAN